MMATVALCNIVTYCGTAQTERAFAGGEPIHLLPSRYLVYAGEGEPAEVSLAAQPVAV